MGDEHNKKPGFLFDGKGQTLLSKLKKVDTRLEKHGGIQRVFLYYKFDEEVNAWVKGLLGRRYSMSKKCWHLPYNDESRTALQRMGVQVSFEWGNSEKMKQRAPKKPTKHVINEKTREKINEVRTWMEQKRYSESTIRTYVSFLRQFFSKHSDVPWDGLNRDIVSAYNHMFFIKGGRSLSAQNQWISAMRMYIQVQRLDDGFMVELERPRKVQRLPNVLTKEEVGRIIRSTRNAKHKCLLAIVYGAGLRIGEALRLRLEDIRRTENLLYIRKSKGNKDRRVPLSQTLLNVMEAYYIAYRPRQLLFEGQGGGSYSPRSAQQVLKRACLVAGIGQKVTLHTLRHSYATHLLEQGVGLRYIQEVLGHNSPKTTMIYTHVSGKRLSQVISPIEDIKI